MLSRALKLAILMILCWLPQQAHAAVAVSAARVWPAQDYTRLTLESKQAIRHNMFIVSNPERLVIDLEDVDLGDTLNGLTKLVGEDDPYIKSVRVGRFKPGVVRLVLDLKSEVKPQLFVLKPVGEYGYRLVLDVYPAQPLDPLMALLEQPKVSDAQAASAPAATVQAAEEPPVGEKPGLAQDLGIGTSVRSPSPKKHTRTARPHADCRNRCRAWRRRPGRNRQQRLTRKKRHTGNCPQGKNADR